MTTQALATGTKVFLRFTAVDLVTLAVFAAVYRALWYVWNALNFLFPFNQVLNLFFFCLCGIAALVIVRKVGAGTLYVIGGLLIDILLQGEALVVAVVIGVMGLSADIYCYILKSAGRDPYGSMRQMVTTGTIWAIFLNIGLFIVTLKLIFQVPLDDAILVAVLVAATVAGLVGSAIGFALGDKTKGLIG